MRVITVATLSSLARARALASSLQRHAPTWSLEVVLVACEEVVKAEREREQTLRLRSVCQELDLDIAALLALHDEQELEVLLVPALLRRLAQQSA
ncbi:MAG TPA: hypothetical protein VN892_11445, partial [Solirubrobacteraceae bacterium]|nr:hypothetical protein [Solirubrobacteraceae bacterium]